MMHLKMEEGATSQEMQVTSRAKKCKKAYPLLEPPQEHSSANTLILDQWDPLWNDFQSPDYNTFVLFYATVFVIIFMTAIGN